MMLSGFLRNIRANILVGFFLTVPIVATIVIFNVLFKFATNWIPRDAFPKLSSIWGGYLLRLVTLVGLIVVFYLIGLFMRNILGRRLYRLGEAILVRIPIIKSVYRPVRQVSASLFTQRKTLFREVVLVQYPRRGLYSLAFVTAQPPPRVARHIAGSQQDTPCVCLFIPTTPNPTSGVFIIAARSEVTPTGTPVTEALTFVMSAGAVPAEEAGAEPPTLLDKLETWLKQRGENSHD